MKDSELLKDLISLAFDNDPDDIKISLADCLDFYARTLAAENAEQAKPVKKVKQAKEPEAPAGEPVDDANAPKTLGAKGYGAAFKNAAYARLRKYREEHGPDCYKKIAQATNGSVRESDVLKMATGTVAPTTVWQIVDAAIDWLEKGEG